MLATASARSAARTGRLAAAREFAAEVVQHAEKQVNLGLEDKILGNLSGIVMEAIDCLRNDQPFRSSSLSVFSLELLSYLRQANKPMIYNFACAFTMLMSEMEGIDLSERGEQCNSRGDMKENGKQRCNSNSKHRESPDAKTTDRASTAPCTSASNASLLPRPLSALATDSLNGVIKEEFIEEEPEMLFQDSIEFNDMDLSIKSDQQSFHDELPIEDGVSEPSGIDNTESVLLQKLIDNFSHSVPSASLQDIARRSEVARNQPKNRSGRFESRDDELAASYNLPVSAAEIETMAGPDLARLLRSDELSEEQRAVLRQIRKRARVKISSREFRKRKVALRNEEK